METSAKTWQTSAVPIRRSIKGSVVENSLAKSVKIFAYVVVLLMVVSIAYASYISVRYFGGIGV